VSRKVTRRSFVKTAALGAAATMLAVRTRGQSITFARKPNLLVFLPDQLRADMLACYGARYPFAPNLDTLARQSSIFERAYVAQAICTPSRSALLSGTWPHENGCIDNSKVLPSRFRCFPELLGDTDYRTGYLGKWHLGDELRAQHGFSEWASIIDGKPLKVGKGEDPAALSDYGRFLVSKGLKPRHHQKNFGHKTIARLPLELSRVKFLETKACGFLQRHARDPFILFIAFYEPHPPYDGPLNNEHPIERAEVDPTFGQIFGDDMPDRYRQRQFVQSKTMAPNVDAYRTIKQHYLGLVTEVDRTIGAVLTKLDQLGLSENTIVVHTSDHGEMMGAHGLFKKSVMFEESARVPYLVRLPGQTRSQRIGAPISHIDFAPTLLDLLGKRPPEQCSGVSRVPLLQSPGLSAGTAFAQWGGRENIFRKVPDAKPPNDLCLHESTRAAMSTDGWKLCLRDLDKNELYNLRDDPREEHNLYNDARGRDVVTRLTREIHQWQERTKDTIQLKA
jgi:arylsulfatase A-like enzyme